MRREIVIPHVVTVVVMLLLFVSITPIVSITRLLVNNKNSNLVNVDANERHIACSRKKVVAS